MFKTTHKNHGHRTLSATVPSFDCKPIQRLAVSTAIACTPLSFASADTAIASAPFSSAFQVLNEFSSVQVFEFIIAALVSSSVIIAIVALFFGNFVGRNERRKMRELREQVVSDKAFADSAYQSINQHEQNAARMLSHMHQQQEKIAHKKHQAWVDTEQITKVAESVSMTEAHLTEISDNVSASINKVQSHWDQDLQQTADTIHAMKRTLAEGIDEVDQGFSEIKQRQEASHILLDQILASQEHQQSALEQNNSTAEAVNNSLNETLERSQALIAQLNKKQHQANIAIEEFTSKINHFEQNVYESYDNAYASVDIANQELNANLQESHNHVEAMRRLEDQTRVLAVQSQKHFQELDFTRINKLSSTIGHTQTMFNNLQHGLENAQDILEDLAHIEAEIKHKRQDLKAANESFTGDFTADAGTPAYATTAKPSQPMHAAEFDGIDLTANVDSIELSTNPVKSNHDTDAPEHLSTSDHAYDNAEQARAFSEYISDNSHSLNTVEDRTPTLPDFGHKAQQSDHAAEILSGIKSINREFDKLDQKSTEQNDDTTLISFFAKRG